MGKKISENRDIAFLLPHNLDDWLPSNHPARFLDAFVDGLDLDELGFMKHTGERGRSYYGTTLLLKVFLYAYFRTIKGHRAMELQCNENIAFLWLTGMNHPDHNTLWRFYDRNKKAIQNLFKQSVKLACELELVDVVLCAVDGTKIVADVSKKKTIHKKDLLYIKKNVDEIAKEKANNFESNDDQNDDTNSDIIIPRNLKDIDLSKENIKKMLDDLDLSETNHLNKTDQDARLMKTNDGSIKMAYNGQATVDSKIGIIVGCDLTNKGSDNNYLNKMISTTLDNIGVVPNLTLADGGYCSGYELYKADENDYNVLVNAPRKTKQKIKNLNWEYHISKFEYDSDSDTYTCPKGELLEFVREIKKSEYSARKYRCRNYKSCKYVTECTKSKRGRTIEVNPYKSYIDKQLELLKNENNKLLLNRRKTIVEPVFGYIKRILNFRRFTVRTIENVTTQWNLICTTINLRKIYAYAFK